MRSHRMWSLRFHAVGSVLVAAMFSPGCATPSVDASRHNLREAPHPVIAMTQTQRHNRDAVTGYLRARDVESTLVHCASEYRPRLLEWDKSLRAECTIRQLAVNDDAAIVVIHETNDFARLIDFPGWDGTITCYFDEHGKIKSSKFTPAPGMMSWRPYLDAALPWLREHRAAELAIAFPNDRLRQDAEAARLWVKILSDWRAATKRAERSPHTDG